MSSYGIDYGYGRTNIDSETGIRFGVIPLNDLRSECQEDFEADYGEPNCPSCGGVVEEFDAEKHGEFDRGLGCSDYACPYCESVFDSSDCFPEEANAWVLDDGRYKAFIDSHNDVMILKSPFYTHAQYCSPCAPGACHLRHPVDKNGPRVYCFDHDWFEGDKSPYPVYEVATGQFVKPPRKELGHEH